MLSGKKREMQESMNILFFKSSEVFLQHQPFRYHDWKGGNLNDFQWFATSTSNNVVERCSWWIFQAYSSLSGQVIDNSTGSDQVEDGLTRSPPKKQINSSYGALQV